MAQLLLQSTLEFTALFILLYSYISTSFKLHVTCAKILERKCCKVRNISVSSCPRLTKT